MALVFIYGTLKRGFINAPHMREAQYLGEARTKESFFKMLAVADYDYMYPAVITGGTCYIEGEIYDVSAPLMNFLDGFEGAEYRRGEIQLEDGRTAEVYLYNRDPSVWPCIETHPQIHYDAPNNTYHWTKGDI